MRDARISRAVRRVQTHRSSPAGITVFLSLGVALLSTGCVQPNQSYPLSLSQNHVRIPSLAPVVQAVMPAVVHVSAVQRPSRMTIGEESSAGLRRSKHQSTDRGSPTAALDELRRFFGMPEMPIKSMGSGFIIDPDGYIVTEDHVVENAEKVTVTFQDGKPHSARIIGRDPKTDLALLKIEVDHPLPYVGWGDSDTAQVGDWVVAIGNPFGLDASVSSGIISGRGRDIHLGPYDDFLQIDAAINLGNSGGPAFDLCGQVIGINTAIYLPNSGSVGIGFAVPANLAQPVIAQLKTRGNVERGWLGVRIQDLTPEIAQSFGLPKAEGGLVADVTADGPAAQAGFAQGDVILSVNGQETRPAVRTRGDACWSRDRGAGMAAECRDRAAAGDRQNAGKPANRGECSTRKSSPAERFYHWFEPRSADCGATRAAGDPVRRQWRDCPVDRRRQHVSGFGIRPGDVIESVNQQPVTSPGEATVRLKRALASEQNNVLMLINRYGTNRYLAMSLENEPNGRDDG